MGFTVEDLKKMPREEVSIYIVQKFHKVFESIHTDELESFMEGLIQKIEWGEDVKVKEQVLAMLRWIVKVEIEYRSRYKS